MKKFLATLILLLNIGLYNAHAESKGIILVISSYNPDTQRMSSFINEFEKDMANGHPEYQILIEDMACKKLADYQEWENTLTSMLDSHKDKSVKAVILLGQEAFITYISLPDIPKDIPFFVCFASATGYDLFDSFGSKGSVDMIEKAQQKGLSGGYVNSYNVEKNINLIMSLYPDTKHIAFISDNTYGGISLQALVRKEMEKFPKLKLNCIDSRHIDQQSLPALVQKLPLNTVLLMGTWRVDRNGMYMISQSINSLTSLNRDIPVFTLTGTGLGTVALGGYVPKYVTSGKVIAGQIKDYYDKGINPYFVVGNGGYTFYRDILKAFSLRESHLPKDSIILDDTQGMLKKYRNYIYLSLTVIGLLIFMMTWLYKIYRRNKMLQRDIIIAKNRAEESDRLKTAFLANMGHEIRTPLNSIVGFSNLLCEEPFPEESKDEYCHIIQHNSQLLLTLIGDILDIARMEAGKMQFNFADEDLMSIGQQVILTVEHLRSDKPDVKLIYKPGADNVMINTDIQRLSQILINLLSNALKFTEQGSVTLSYEVKKSKNCVWFTVTDTGCGITPELHSKIFNRFEKLNNYKQGTGLGLAICKQIALHFGGDVWIDSSYTTGARFVFSHPLERK